MGHRSRSRSGRRGLCSITLTDHRVAITFPARRSALQPFQPSASVSSREPAGAVAPHRGAGGCVSGMRCIDDCGGPLTRTLVHSTGTSGSLHAPLDRPSPRAALHAVSAAQIEPRRCSAGGPARPLSLARADVRFATPATARRPRPDRIGDHRYTLPNSRPCVSPSMASTSSATISGCGPDLQSKSAPVATLLQSSWYAAPAG